MNLNKAQCEANYSFNYNLQQNGLGATRANIIKLLKSLDLIGWSTHEESGKLDRKAFTRFKTGSTAIFSKRTHVEAERSAVSVLIDCSGSMNEFGKIQVAETLAIQLSRILDKADVSFNVTGFHGRQTSIRDVARGASKEIAVGYEVPTFIPFKQWNESLQRCAPKLGSINQWANRSTPDYSSIAITLDELAHRNEARKILFLITDADCYNQAHMVHLQGVADKLGVTIIAIGIGATSVKECFRSSDNVISGEGLASASFNKLLKELK
jgi:cobalamin biosynthesis protein CobT